MLTPKENEKGRDETRGPFHSGLDQSCITAKLNVNNFGQKLHENTSEVLLCSCWIFTKTELLYNALQTEEFENAGFLFSCGRKTF